MNEIAELTLQIRELKAKRDALVKKVFVPTGYRFCVEHGMPHPDTDEFWNVGRKRCRVNDGGAPVKRRRPEPEEVASSEEPEFKYPKIAGGRMGKTQKELGLWYEMTPTPTLYYRKDGQPVTEANKGATKQDLELAWIRLRARAAVEARLYEEEDSAQVYGTAKERRLKARDELENATLEQLWNIGENYMNRKRRLPRTG